MNACELKSDFESLPSLEPETIWDDHRLALRKHIANDNIKKFLRWSTIQATMFVGEAPYIKDEFEALMQDRDLWEPVIQEPGIGNPPRLSYAPWTSGNLVHQAYHIKQWLDATGQDLSELFTIFEIGGGYGAMALICRRLGFDGVYFLLDYPEFLFLQNFYLDNLGISAEYISDILYSAIDFFDLMIAMFSLSEMKMTRQRELLEILPAKSYLIGYQPQWQGVDNHWHFGKWIEGKPDLKWSNYFSPHFNNHWYLMGRRE